MNFLAYVETVEDTLPADYNVRLERKRSEDQRVEWIAGALSVELGADGAERVA